MCTVRGVARDDRVILAPKERRPRPLVPLLRPRESPYYANIDRSGLCVSVKKGGGGTLASLCAFASRRGWPRRTASSARRSGACKEGAQRGALLGRKHKRRWSAQSRSADEGEVLVSEQRVRLPPPEGINKIQAVGQVIRLTLLLPQWQKKGDLVILGTRTLLLRISTSRSTLQARAASWWHDPSRRGFAGRCRSAPKIASGCACRRSRYPRLAEQGVEEGLSARSASRWQSSWRFPPARGSQ